MSPSVYSVRFKVFILVVLEIRSYEQRKSYGEEGPEKVDVRQRFHGARMVLSPALSLA